MGIGNRASGMGDGEDFTQNGRKERAWEWIESVRLLGRSNFSFFILHLCPASPSSHILHNSSFPLRAPSSQLLSPAPPALSPRLSTPRRSTQVPRFSLHLLAFSFSPSAFLSSQLPTPSSYLLSPAPPAHSPRRSPSRRSTQVPRFSLHLLAFSFSPSPASSQLPAPISQLLSASSYLPRLGRIALDARPLVSRRSIFKKLIASRGLWCKSVSNTYSPKCFPSRCTPRFEIPSP